MICSWCCPFNKSSQVVEEDSDESQDSSQQGSAASGGLCGGQWDVDTDSSTDAGIVSRDAEPLTPSDPALDGAIRAMTLVSPDGEPVSYVSYRLAAADRQAVFATAFPQCAAPNKVITILAKTEAGATQELVAVMNNDGSPSPALVTCSCQITYEDLSPSDCVEYSFAESPGQWALAKLSRDALESYRGMKFEAWRKMLLEGTCEAQLRRMLQIGVVTRLYDPHVFPTPEQFRSKYEVVDDRSGRLIQLPHAVSSLRVWDANSQCYQHIDPHLTGAPRESEKDAWWTSCTAQLKQKYGADYIDALLHGD